MKVRIREGSKLRGLRDRVRGRFRAGTLVIDLVVFGVCFGVVFLGNVLGSNSVMVGYRSPPLKKKVGDKIVVL